MATTGAQFRVATAVAAVLCAAAIFAAPAARAAGELELGAYVPGAPGSAQALDQFAGMVGRQPQIVMWYRDLGLPLFYSNERATMSERGGTPMVTWEPLEGDKAIPLSEIAGGGWDSEIAQAADLAKTWDGELMIRFAHEMNLPVMPWGPGREGSGAGNYIGAWRRIVSIFRQRGASNVRFVWAPNIDYGGRPFSQFFPGDEWVDYVALDGYNFGTSAPGESWQSLREVFDSSYATLTELSARPVIISETASTEIGGDKANWIKRGFLKDIPGCFPRIKAVVWYHKDLEADWRIDSSSASVDAYRSVASSSLYGGPTPHTDGLGCDRTPPTIRRLTVTRLVADARRSGRIAYQLSERATVTIAVHRRTAGGGFKRVATLRGGATAGRNRLRFRRRIGGRPLRAGTYRLVVTAADESRNRSHPRRARFRVI